MYAFLVKRYISLHVFALRERGQFALNVQNVPHSPRFDVLAFDEAQVIKGGLDDVAGRTGN